MRCKQAWAILEVRRRNPKKARQYFEAAVTADSTHAAAWHGWGLLEKQEVSAAARTACFARLSFIRATSRVQDLAA